MELKKKLANAIEQTCLKPFATHKDIHKICEEAMDWHFHGVCLAPIWLKEAHTYLKSSPVRLVTVAGFPTGAISTTIKCKEIEEAVKGGAHEIDFVLNIGWVKEQRCQLLEEEFKQLVSVAQGIPLKIILETCYLTNAEKEQASQAALANGVTFIKTSTGFGTNGATLEDIRLIRRLTSNIKASGGIKDTPMALALLDAGACRLGTSSGVAIMEGLQTQSLQKNTRMNSHANT